MISIIVVYNNERIWNKILLPSLKNQTAKFELILVDNTKGKFKSAAEALNYGGNQANGKYLMFVHQDVELGSNSWLEKAETILDNINDLGIAGVAGVSEEGRGREYLSDCGEIWERSNVSERPEAVQTLDELLLIIPKAVFTNLQFDEESFSGWHCYGVDYCLSVRRKGLKVYVIPIFVYHRSLRLNVEGLRRYQKRLYRKHWKHFKKIYTTCGEISGLKFRLKPYIEGLKPLYRKFFLSEIELLKKHLSDCNSVLDLGCGYNSPIQHCGVPFSVGVELFGPYLKESEKKGIHNQYIREDIQKIEFTSKSFDAIIAVDVLEHLKKEEGRELLVKMERWARKKIIITMPNGYLWQGDYDNNPLQTHKCGWNSRELRKLGFKVYGMNGWKNLRGYKGSIKRKPFFLWERISDLSQKVTYWYPEFAFQLFAVKKIKNNER